MTQKIVINACHGGFGLSAQAQARYCELAGYDLAHFHWEVDRSSPHLIAIVEQLGEAANMSYSQLKIVEIPDGVEWTVCEYDGWEWVAEAHQTWS